MSSDINTRITSVANDIESLTADALDEVSRKKLLDVVMHAANKLEPPVETIWRLIMSVRLTPRNDY